MNITIDLAMTRRVPTLCITVSTVIMITHITLLLMATTKTTISGSKTHSQSTNNSINNDSIMIDLVDA